MNGLILIGGRSRRMGTDKSLLIYNDLPQRDFLYQLLQKYCDKTFLSCRPEQMVDLQQFNTLPDLYENTGPMGGILTAFDNDPNTAWLVVACDMPFINQTSISFLVGQRNMAKTATAFKNADQQPEPLFCIYEPSAYLFFKNAFDNGQRSPMNVLKLTDCQLVVPKNEQWIQNINS